VIMLGFVLAVTGAVAVTAVFEPSADHAWHVDGAFALPRPLPASGRSVLVPARDMVVGGARMLTESHVLADERPGRRYGMTIPDERSV